MLQQELSNSWRDKNGLISEESEFNPPISDNNHLSRSDTNNCSDVHIPQCLIALGRLQLVNKPEAVDLYPHRFNEFLTRHSADTLITFCDQRVQNVLGLETNEVLGQAFGNLLPSSRDKISFQEVFDKAWKLKGQSFTIMVHMRSKLFTELLFVKCHLTAFVNPYSEEVEYVICTTSSIKAFESETSGSNPNTTYTENNTYGQTKVDFFERTSHVTHANCSVVRDHINTTPIQPNPKSSTYIHPVNQAKESHLSNYWRHTNENTDHFDPGFAIQPSTTEINLPSDLDHQSYPFSGQIDSSLNKPSSLHSLSCSNTQLIPQSNQEHANIQHHTDPVSGDYLSSIPNNYGTLRNGTDFPTSDVQVLNNFDHKRNNPLDVNCAFQASNLNTGDCIVQTSESGLTRPSAICFMPSDSVGDCGCDITENMSPHTMSYLNINRPFGNHETYLPSIDITSDSRTYQQPITDHPTSAFHGWYDPSLPSSSISTSESSSIPSDIYHQPVANNHTQDDLSTSDFVYPQPHILQVNNETNNCIQQNPLQQPSYDYFKYTVQ
uniref:PAS domain-containing protein n=1 Tax=Schistosoma mansoni TaxID=6183 RepID=A0A5K4FEI0_SCHMA